MFRLGFFILLLSLALLVFSCGNGNNTGNPGGIPTSVVNNPQSASGSVSGGLPKMIFSDTAYDFGTIKQGDKVTHIFTYTNTGAIDLVISSATGSCGCTVPTTPNKLTKPGATGTVEVTFDSSGKSGKVEKSVYVTTNCQPNVKTLTITANITTP
jgi:hypothetical protein